MTPADSATASKATTDQKRAVLQIVVASTRPGRVGRPLADWVERTAADDGRFSVELIDLAVVNLPFFDEPNHPRIGPYVHQHTKDWSATVSRADAFVFVTPEYNHSFNAVLKNALDFLHNEWQHKPVAFLGYGGVAAGTRAIESLIPVVAALRMVPILDSVVIPFAGKVIDDNGAVQPNDNMKSSIKSVLDELVLQTALLADRRRPAHATNPVEKPQS